MDKNLKLTRKEIHTINQNIESIQIQFRARSVLEFMKKLIYENNGFLRISVRNINILYGEKHFKFSMHSMDKVIDELVRLELLKVDKSRKTTAYFLGESEFEEVL